MEFQTSGSAEILRDALPYQVWWMIISCLCAGPAQTQAPSGLGFYMGSFLVRFSGIFTAFLQVTITWYFVIPS